ncbi:KxYKxGKxW signal peptide domain-containing protein, partial [Listeria seeligeri]
MFRKNKDTQQKNWRLWKKGKQWVCGATLFFTVVASPGLTVLATEVNAAESEVPVTEEEASKPVIPSEALEENETEPTTGDGATPLPEETIPEQAEENANAPSNSNGSGQTSTESEKETSSQTIKGIQEPTAISSIFPDANLAQKICSELSRYSVDDMVTQAELDSITSLNIWEVGITNLSGVENLTSLTNLSIDHSQISDISPLAGLTSLRELDLASNQISDISPLAGLTSLDSLDLASNQISDISLLAGLTSLRELDLTSNQISDISPLAGLTSLRILGLENNQISDISPLAGLTSLGSLDLASNQISDISLLAGLTSLSVLQLTSNQISDISPLVGLTNMRSLYLENNQISDISPLAGLTKAHNVHLDSNQISDISPLAGLTSLGVLDLDNNQISDISSLAGLTSLSNLFLDNNQVSDISPLAGLMRLYQLYLSSNQISDLSPLNGYGYHTKIVAPNQSVTLPEIGWSNPLNVSSVIKGTSGNIIAPSSVSQGGIIAGPAISWTIPNVASTVSYDWNDTFVTSQGSSQTFSGRATIGVKQALAVRILIDSDGNSGTTGDQTLLREEKSGLTTAEDVYNYAKEQLTGTNYGLVDIQVNDIDHTVVVSEVGTLKAVDSNGDSVAADVSYIPTYQVTGTGDAAQLDVSYQATVGTPPPGYLYIYGKDTAQEIRYTTSTPVTIPATDTNGNGVPEWRESYTVVQYQKAGGLNPVTPDGNPVPGGTIAIPEDALAGDVIRVPDIIGGSDGKEYVVDPSADEDVNTPGVQITLTDEEQNIPYLDAISSESESSSGSESSSSSESSSESESESSSSSESSSESESESSSASESNSESESESSSTSESSSESDSESSSASESNS